MARHSLALLAMVAVAVVTSGCTISFGGIGSDDRGETQGGIYKTVTIGERWLQQSSLASTGQPSTFGRVGVAAITLDPGDHEAVYAGTIGGGLVYSFDGAQSWQIARDVGQRVVRSVAVSAVSQCRVYASAENRIFKTSNCSRDWEQMYFDNDPAVTINTLAVHPQDDRIVYAGNSRGEIIVSNDGGKSWAIRKRFEQLNRRQNNAILKLIINTQNPQTIWAATANSGVHVSRDGGASWQSYVEQFMEIHTRDALMVRDIALAAADGTTLVAATAAGLIRTVDNGETWEVMELVPPADSTEVNTVAVYAGDADRIYYATNTSFGYTTNGGESWTSKNLPSVRGVQTMLVDFTDPEIIYLGMKSMPQN